MYALDTQLHSTTPGRVAYANRYWLFTSGSGASMPQVQRMVATWNFRNLCVG